MGEDLGYVAWREPDRSSIEPCVPPKSPIALFPHAPFADAESVREFSGCNELVIRFHDDSLHLWSLIRPMHEGVGIGDKKSLLARKRALAEEKKPHRMGLNHSAEGKLF
ncbi:hypothetical protein [Crystallibacter degradans]|uniref:hypothetical protein n=1 Tax=Crystallibacter degradans TaxID=2726743 RepID=UPI001472F1AC|nr:hypothetical protein [Arthrobacter sp. SF27]NMR30924.1 hypothetical protein [Arthrobacter sp. SF27]